MTHRSRRASSPVEIRPFTSPQVRRLVVIFWTLTCVAIPLWAAFDTPGWDFAIYTKAARSFYKGHDPYADETGGKGDYKRDLSPEYGKGTSSLYVYSPLVLEIASRAEGHPWVEWLYWALYATGALTTVLVTSLALEDSDPTYTAAIPAAALFFPGLLQNDTILSGNVAIILYGLILGAAVLGWRYRQWFLLYVFVIIASCFKLPFLTLLLIPALSAPGEWKRATASAFLGAGLFSAQFFIWPSMSRHQLVAIDHLISFNRDVGCSPAGLLSGFFFDRGLPHSLWPISFFFLYSMAVLAILVHFSHHFFRGHIRLSRWMPLLLVGVTLLNPRILEYDVLPLTVPMALICVRSVENIKNRKIATAALALLFLALNAIVLRLSSTVEWKAVEDVLLVTVFGIGCWGIRRFPSVNLMVEEEPVAVTA